MQFAKTRNTTRLKCCTCHASWRWTRPKCCACHENCNASSENVAKVLRLPQNDFRRVTNTSECHEVPCLPRETKQRDVLTSKNDHFCRTYHRHGHTVLTRTVASGCGRLRTVANGCGHKRNVERTHPQPPDPQSETGTLATHSGKRAWRTFCEAIRIQPDRPWGEPARINTSPTSSPPLAMGPSRLNRNEPPQ